jgi:microcystin-dependent protein
MSADAPIGSISAFAGPGPLDSNWENANGWLLCDGRPLDRTQSAYQNLFNAIGSSWGGDGVNSFNLPDLRGRFLRGVDGNTNRDKGPRSACQPGGHAGLNEVGSVEDDSFGAHSHNVHGCHLEADGGHGFDGTGLDTNSNQSGPWQHDVTTSTTGSAETRPINASVFWIIRFK